MIEICPANRSSKDLHLFVWTHMHASIRAGCVINKVNCVVAGEKSGSLNVMINSKLEGVDVGASRSTTRIDATNV